MASTPEKAVKAKVKAILESEGAYFFMPPANGYGRAGIPDIICCVAGHFLAIECKAAGNKPTALQERELSDIRNAGGVAVVINETNWDIVRDIVRKLKGQVA